MILSQGSVAMRLRCGAMFNNDCCKFTSESVGERILKVVLAFGRNVGKSSVDCVGYECWQCSCQWQRAGACCLQVDVLSEVLSDGAASVDDLAICHAELDDDDHLSVRQLDQHVLMSAGDGYHVDGNQLVRLVDNVVVLNRGDQVVKCSIFSTGVA